MATPFDWQRKKLSLNNACDLVLAGETGDSLFLSSRARNQFLENRELYLGCMIKSRVSPQHCYPENHDTENTSCCDQQTAYQVQLWRGRVEGWSRILPE
jgi:hypothetical protein